MNKPPLLLFALCLAACDNAASVPDTDSADEMTVPAGITRQQPRESGNAAMPSEPKRLTLGTVSLSYDPARLAQVEADIPVPPDWKVIVHGMKLVASDRAKLVDTAECLYGESGEASRCNAAREAGLGIAYVDQSYDRMKAALADPPATPMRIGGREGMVWKIGAEGEGADYMIAPAGTKTLLLVHQYRSSANPDAAALQAALDSLTIKE